MIAINLGQTSLQNFYLRTACSVDLNFTDEICDSLGGGPYEVDSFIIRNNCYDRSGELQVKHGLKLCQWLT